MEGIGKQILADGGNAFDAIVATALAGGITQPHQTGVGGYAAHGVFAYEGGKRIIPGGAEIAILERLELAQFGKMFASLHEGLAGKTVALASLGLFEAVMAGFAHGKVAPVEVNRPLVTATAGKAYEKVQPIPGAEQALKDLQALKLILATTTGFDRPLTTQILSRLGWQHYFAASITSDDVMDGRPAPYMLFRAMEAGKRARPTAEAAWRQVERLMARK